MRSPIYIFMGFVTTAVLIVTAVAISSIYSSYRGQPVLVGQCYEIRDAMYLIQKVGEFSAIASRCDRPKSSYQFRLKDLQGQQIDCFDCGEAK